MCVLSGDDLLRRGPELVSPFSAQCVQPNTIDLHLGDALLVDGGWLTRLAYPQGVALSLQDNIWTERWVYVHLTETPDHQPVIRRGENGVPYIACSFWKIRRFEFLLGRIAESVRIPPDLTADLWGKSTYARRALSIHQTGGLIDTGFPGAEGPGILTIECFNACSVEGIPPINLSPGMPIAQIRFLQTSSPVTAGYGSPRYNNHYAGQDDVRPAWFTDFVAPVINRAG